MKLVAILILLVISFSILSAKDIEFISNKGQLIYHDKSHAEDVLFTAKVSGKRVYVRNSGLSFVYSKFEKDSIVDTKSIKDRLFDDFEIPSGTLTTHRMDLELIEPNSESEIVGLEKLEVYNNYYLPHCKVTHVPIYGKVKYKNVYDNIDMVLYTAENGDLEYDFVIKPGGNPQDIKFKFEYTDGVEKTEQGSLLIKNPLGELEQLKPRTFQDRKEIESNFIISDDGTISFELGDYDKTKELVIDPLVRMWGTYYGV